MADLTPDAPNVVAQAPESKVGGDAFQRTPAVGIGAGLEALGQGAEDLAVPLAKLQATQDVAALTSAAGKDATVGRNPDGTPYAFPTGSSYIFGRAGLAAQDVLATGVQNGLAAKISEHLTDLHTQFQTDPAAFKNAADQFATKLQTDWAPIAGQQTATALSTLAARESAQRYQGLVQQNTSRNVELDKQGLLTSISDTQNNMRNLARSGGMNTPEFDNFQQQLQQKYDALKGNPLYGVSATTADSQMATAQSMFRVEGVLGQVESIFKRGGGAGGKAAAEQFLYSQIRDNQDLHLSPEEKDRLVNYGLNHLAYLTSDQKARIDANRQSTNKIIDLYASGKDVDPALADAGIAQANSVGDAESAQRIGDYKWAHEKAGPYNGLNDEQRVIVGAHQDYISKTSLKESGGRDNPDGGNGGGQFQFTPGTWNDLMTKHPELGLTADGRADRAQGYKAMVALTNDNRAALQAAGITPTDANTYMAHFLGAGGAISFLRSMGSDPSRPAAASNLKAAAANPNIFYKNGDPSQPRSLAEVYQLQTQRFGGLSSATTPVVAPGLGGAPTPADIAQHPFALAAYADMQKAGDTSDIKAAKNVGEALITQLKSGNEPQPETTAAYLQMAAKYPKELGEQAQTVGNVIVGRSNEKYAEGLQTTAEGQAYVDKVATLANSGTDLNTMAKSAALTDIWKRAQERLKTEQFVEATNRHWIDAPPPALDFSKLQTLLPNMVQRGDAALKIAAHTQNIETPAFTENEVPMVKSIAAAGTDDQKMALITSIVNARMPEPVLRATLKQLGSEKETQTMVASALVAANNPAAGMAIMQGQTAMKTDARLAPNKDDFPSAFAAKLPFNDLPAGAFRDTLDAGIQAAYAKASADAGDVAGILKQDRLDKAVEDVTGGLATYRGSTVIGPWYGAGQAGLDSTLRTLTDADFAGARTKDGATFPASAIKPSIGSNFFGQGWRLQSLSDGKYLVFSGTDDKRQYLYNDKNTKFILDLGAKRAQAENAGLFLAPSLTDAYLNTAAMGFH